MLLKNVIIAQSGGPSSVINNSLRGIIDACKSYPGIFNKIYGAWHGIEGVLKEELIDLSIQDEEEIELLRTTPAAGSIGTCRYKLKDEQNDDFDRLLDVFRNHKIGFFFYIGGNDSQHTALKVGELAESEGLDLISVGVPKTIDNDVGDNEFKLIDHTPGYGSVARYWSHIIQNANEENMGSCPADPVLVIQAMGRKIGYIPAAARLADPNREMPLQIYLAETKPSLEKITDNVNDELKKNGRCIVVVSEGLEIENPHEIKDLFGHANYGSSGISVAQSLVNYMNKMGLKAKGSARGQIMGTDQRHAMIYASTVDLDEAYNIGLKAVEIAILNGNGWMATILRKPTKDYKIYYDKVELKDVALSEREFPANWIAENNYDVKDEFINYVRPLTGNEWIDIPLVNGIQRFARIKRIFVEKKLDKYVPQAYR
ncbi:diphosphate--fructose-6-phosphate 1-phosphotransferase [Bacteroidota bacterium]